MVSIARSLTAFLGFLSTYFIYEAYVTLELDEVANIEDVLGTLIESAFELFFHLFLILLALPFMLNSIFVKDKIPKWFAITVGIESALNTIFAYLIFARNNDVNNSGWIITGLEALPLLFLLLSSRKIN